MEWRHLHAKCSFAALRPLQNVLSPVTFLVPDT